MMKFGKTRFYADENIEQYLIDYIRDQGFRVDSATELGLSPRDDKFHLQEARHRKAILLTKDTDFLDHRRFAFHNLKDTGIVILRTKDNPENRLNYGYMLVCLLDEVGTSGTQNLSGLKIEIKGPKIIIHARVDGQIKQDTIDVSSRIQDRWLFTD
jgi:predicted nuclease of predicted toxin-antitoxin system